MKNFTIAFPVIAALGLALVACDTGEPLSSDELNPVGSASQATTSVVSYDTTSVVSYDTTAIASAPSALLPAQPLSLRAFSLANVQRALVQTSETFEPGPHAGTRTTFDARSWHAEVDGSRGQVLAVSQVMPGASVPQSDRAMQLAAQQRLSAFGIPGAEIHTLWQRRSMTNDEQDGAYGTPEVDGYKTFAIRGINGVGIRGHRAVITHGGDGIFRRALVKWPALAASGHKLRTRLPTADITARAVAAVRAEGLTTGVVALNWLYAPVQLPNGEVTLTLKVVATLPYDTALGESRLVEVDVDAL